MQSSSQLANDIGASTDDSYKQTYQTYTTVSIGRKKVKPFTDTFTMISHSFIVAHTRQIHKRLDAASSATTNVTNSNNNNASKADSIIEEDTNEHEIQVAATNESVGNADLGIEQVKDNMCNSGHIEEDEDDGTEIRSRAKSDIWHEFHNTPLKKDCLASPSIFILLRVATQNN